MSIHYLLLNDRGIGRIILSVSLDEVESELLADEVEKYNSFMDVVSRGEAPSSCYTSSWLRDSIYMSRKQFDYQSLGLTLGQWERNTEEWECRLFLLDSRGFAYEKDEKGDRLQYKLLERAKKIARNDPLFFLEKYDGKEYSLGYDLLPMTQRAYKRVEEVKNNKKRVRFDDVEELVIDE